MATGPDPEGTGEAELFARLEADLAAPVADGEPVPVARQPDPHDASGPGWGERPGDDDGQPVGGVVVFPRPREGDRGSGGASGATVFRALPDRPLMPGWARDRRTALLAARWAFSYAGHVTAFHGLRAPVYWARLAGRSPAGAIRLTRAVTAWAVDAQGRPVRRALAAAADRTSYGREDASTYVRLEEQRRSLVRGRVLITVTGAFGALVAAWSLLAAVDPVPLTALLLAVLAGLGVVGRAHDTPVLSRFTTTTTAPRLSSELILTALGSLGIGELNKNLRGSGADAVTFPAPISRDGAGWRATVDLPPGVTASDIIERRDRLASGLRRPLGCVWPEVDADTHAARLVLWVGDRSLSDAKPVLWPLRKAGTVNLFTPVPLGVDQCGKPVTVTLMFASGLIGAVPRMGKTFILRLLLLAAALDARCEVHAFNLKGGSDLDPLALVAHRYRVGDDEDDMAYLLDTARTLRSDMRRRYKVLRDLPRDLCPESKVTDALASRRDLGLHPVMVAVDECQVMFEHPTHGAELEEIVTDLVKRGPAVGVMVWLATQRPDAKSIPTGISANAVLRLCLRVMGQLENDMVLGTSTYKAGIRATMFTRKDLGVAWLSGDAEDPVIVRAAYIDAVAAEAVATRARTLRSAADRLTGHAAGIDQAPTDEQSASVLDHLAEVWPAAEARAWCETLAERLAAAHPGTYTGWTGEQVTSAVRPHGLRSTQVKRTIDGRTHNRRGLLRTELHAALTQRDNGSGSGDPGDG